MNFADTPCRLSGFPVALTLEVCVDLRWGRKMRSLFVSLLAMSSLGFAAAAAGAENNGIAETSSYELAAAWPQLVHPFYRAGYALGSQGGIFAESPNRIFLASRGELKLPDKLPAGFNGLWGSLTASGQQGDAPYHVPELR